MKIEEIGKHAQSASRQLAKLSTACKNHALHLMAEALIEKQQELLTANAVDLQVASQQGLSSTFLDRLQLTPSRIASMAEGLRQVAALPDPIGETLTGWKRPNGLEIRKVRVPLGVIGIIYESRPNVTADAAGLCLKAGSSVILRGGSESLESNLAITRVLQRAATRAGVPEKAIQLIETTDREAAQQLMRLNQYVDVLIPRGGAGLIRTVVETATVPVIETGVGNCHTYVDVEADLGLAADVAFNAKVQRCSVCNAMESLLVHRDVADQFLPPLAKRYMEAGVELRGCPRTCALIPAAKEATEQDWHEEYLALILAVKIVDSLDEAIGHIARYSSKHSESIITNNLTHSRRFCEEVDSAAVYVNASTRFTDGFEFGLGAEIGISTQKLHARGPMGLEELTTYKYLILGTGQLRE